METEDRELRERLRRLRVDPPDGGFDAMLRRRLLVEGPPPPASIWGRVRLALEPRGRLLWPAAGVAAGLAVFLALSLVRGRAGPGPDRAVAATRLPATKIAVVRLNLSAEAAVESAHIRVRLPPELAFWADGEELPERTFEWTQPLRSGDNEIPIAVRGQRPGRYRIAVSARIGDERVEDEVVLEVVDG
ncbi:hypothetical protein [Anaeromyxobacter oryzae]|nr:hypothetical protein [Anaeromyxobacter oryzae]